MSDFSFGDDEPEDAYDATDPPAEIVRNLFQRLLLLEKLPRDNVPDSDLRDALALIEVRTRSYNRRTLSGRDSLRVAQILDDIDTLRARL